MLLNNFYSSQLGIIRYQDSYKSSSAYRYSSTDLGRLASTYNYNVTGAFNQNWFQRLKEVGCVVGTGTTPPKPQDWAMESALIRGTDYTLNSFTFQESVGATSSVTYTIAIKNKKEDESITITEIGLFSFTSDFSTMTPLFFRDVIEPITLAPGESHTFVVSFGINLEDN